MKKIIFSFIMLFVCLCIANTITLTIDYSKTSDFGPFLGYNMQIIGADYGFDNPALNEAIKKLKPAYLRFPGGTAGNFYHWKTDSFDENDFTNKRHTWGKTELKGMKENADIFPEGKLGFIKFLELCKKLKAEPIIMFNIYTEDADSPAEFVKYIKSLNKCSKKVHCQVINTSFINGHLNYSNQTMPSVAARIFINNDILYVYIINRGHDNIKIKLEPSKNFIYPGKIQSAGGYLDGSNGIDEYKKNRPVEHVIKLEEKIFDNPDIKLAPFSLTLVTVKYKTP